jgi:hypothetical protein
LSNLSLSFRFIAAKEEKKNRGRTPKFSDALLERIEKLAEQRSLRLDSIRVCDMYDLMVDVLRSEHANNTYVTAKHFSIAKTTMRKYMKKMQLKIVENADIKSFARQRAYQDIRNPMTLCAAREYLSQQVLDEHIFSTDDVSVVLNKWDKPAVITTKAAQEILQKQHIGVSITEEEKKRRVVTFNATVAGDGTTPCVVIKICDKKFTDLKEKPVIHNMGDGLFVALYHGDLSGRVLTTEIYKKCILRTCESKRTQAEQRDLGGVKSSIVHSQSSAGQASQGNSNDNAHSHKLMAAHRFMALCCDGAYDQVGSIMDEINEYARKHSINALFLKYAAACSMTQQVNDRGFMHKLLHAQFTSPSFRYDTKSSVDPPGENWKGLKKFMQEKLEGSSFDTYWRCLQHCQAFLGKAFSKATVQSAFRTSGMVPYDPLEILSTCPAFTLLEQEDADYVIESLPVLAQHCERPGIISERSQRPADHPDYHTRSAPGYHTRTRRPPASL